MAAAMRRTTTVRAASRLPAPMYPRAAARAASVGRREQDDHGQNEREREHRLAEAGRLATQPARSGHDERGSQKDQQKHQIARHEAGDGDEHRADELHTGVHTVQKALPRHIFQKLGH
ncbi:MAG: hypothetical protein ACLUW6_02640 [Coriobacteriaceae bacterium]